MRRKVVKQGHNAMTITLPASWIKDQKISAGDELDVEAKGRELIVKKGLQGGIEKITFQMNGKGKYLHRHLAVLYRLGYDEIKVEFDNPSMVNKIQYEIEFMPGFEIVDQGENFCVVKNISSGLDKEFDNILRKIFLNIIYCGEQSLNLLKQGNIKKIEGLKQLSRVNDRLPNFCERMLRKEGYKDYRKTILVYSMVLGLEQVGDYYNTLFEYLLEHEKEVKINKEILKIYEEVNKLIESYYELFYSFDANKVSNLKEECLDMQAKTKRIIERGKGADSILVLQLCFIVERIYHMTECLI